MQRSVAVDLIAIGIGIASGIEPIDGHAFSVMGGGEQAVDDPFPRSGCRIVEESVDGRGRGRQAGEVEGDAANERGPVRFFCGCQVFLGQSLADEGIDWMGVRGRNGRSFDRLISPVTLIFCSLADPVDQPFFLASGQTFM